MLNDAQSKVIRVEGWGRGLIDSGRMMCVIYWWDVGLGHSLVVMFVRCSKFSKGYA